MKTVLFLVAMLISTSATAGHYDLDLSDNRPAVTVDFIWPRGHVGTIKLPIVAGVHYYVCGLTGTSEDPIIVCSLKRKDKDGNIEGGEMELHLTGKSYNDSDSIKKDM